MARGKDTSRHPNRQVGRYLGWSHNGGSERDPNNYTHLFSSPTGDSTDSISLNFGDWNAKAHLKEGESYELNTDTNTSGQSSRPYPA